MVRVLKIDPSLYKVNSVIYRNSLLPEFHMFRDTGLYATKKKKKNLSLA